MKPFESEEIRLTAFADDSLGDMNMVYPVNGLHASINGNVIYWSSKTQRHVVHSSFESEVDALLELMFYLTWLEGLYADFIVEN